MICNSAEQVVILLVKVKAQVQEQCLDAWLCSLSNPSLHNDQDCVFSTVLYVLSVTDLRSLFSFSKALFTFG